MNEVKTYDIRVFILDGETEEAFECFKDKERVPVEYDWVMKRRTIIGVVVSKKLIDRIQASLGNPDFVRLLKTGLLELYRDYGMITDEQFALYRKTKDESRIIPEANYAN